MNEYQNVLKQAFHRDFLITIAFVIGIIIVGLLLLRLIKSDILPKWTLSILLVGLVLLAVGSIKTINIYNDMQNESYVVYYGNYYQRHQGYEDTYHQTTLLDGDEDIDLLRHFTLPQSTGEYYGIVVYGSKSKIVVYIGEDLTADLQGFIE